MDDLVQSMSVTWTNRSVCGIVAVQPGVLIFFAFFISARSSCAGQTREPIFVCLAQFVTVYKSRKTNLS